MTITELPPVAGSANLRHFMCIFIRYMFAFIKFLMLTADNTNPLAFQPVGWGGIGGREYKKEKIRNTINLEAGREIAESGQSRSLELSIYLTHEIRTLLHSYFFNFLSLTKSAYIPGYLLLISRLRY